MEMHSQKTGYLEHHQFFRREPAIAQAECTKTRADDGKPIADHLAVHVVQKEHAAKMRLAMTLPRLIAKDPSKAEEAEFGPG